MMPLMFSHTEQLSVTIQWVDRAYQVYEDTLGLKELRDTKAETIHHEIKDMLIRCANVGLRLTMVRVI